MKKNTALTHAEVLLLRECVDHTLREVAVEQLKRAELESMRDKLITLTYRNLP